MRRLATVLALSSLTTLLISSSAFAFAHDRITNPYLHLVADVLTLAVVTSPIWSARLWAAPGRRGLIALIALVQLPAGILAFTAIADPALHFAATVGSLLVTAVSLLIVRRSARQELAVVAQV